MVAEVIAKVVCGKCGWSGKRKTGKLVYCPKCSECAAFQIERMNEKKSA